MTGSPGGEGTRPPEEAEAPAADVWGSRRLRGAWRGGQGGVPLRWLERWEVEDGALSSDLAAPPLGPPPPHSSSFFPSDETAAASPPPPPRAASHASPAPARPSASPVFCSPRAADPFPARPQRPTPEPPARRPGQGPAGSGRLSRWPSPQGSPGREGTVACVLSSQVVGPRATALLVARGLNWRRAGFVPRPRLQWR